MAKRLSTKSNGDAGPAAEPPTRRLRLDTVAGVRREMVRLYAEARYGQLDTQDASRLGNLLAIVARLIESSDLERRLTDLEAAQEGRSETRW